MLSRYTHIYVRSSANDQRSALANSRNASPRHRDKKNQCMHSHDSLSLIVQYLNDMTSHKLQQKQTQLFSSHRSVLYNSHIKSLKWLECRKALKSMMIFSPIITHVKKAMNGSMHVWYPDKWLNTIHNVSETVNLYMQHYSGSGTVHNWKGVHHKFKSFHQNLLKMCNQGKSFKSSYLTHSFMLHYFIHTFLYSLLLICFHNILSWCILIRV